MPRPVLSTYRVQLRGDQFTFADAEGLLDYFAELGISHLYLSPLLTAAPGSVHGYDVTDPITVSPDLGGAEGLARLSTAARERGLGLIVDIVPNHVGVERPQYNPWWWDVLRNGRDSAFASFFDIDWTADPDGRIELPVLGSDDDVNALEVDGEMLRLGDKMLPIAPGTGSGSAAQVHDRQHYRLTGWRTGVCGYRRFFAVTSLAGLRQEDPAVFEASHAQVRRLFAEGLVDGLRVDHPDGLTDPAEYLARLRELAGVDAYIVAEKILAADEALEPTLPVAGTTGYDVLREVGGVFVDPTGRQILEALAGSSGFDRRAVDRLTAQLKTAVATALLASDSPECAAPWWPPRAQTTGGSRISSIAALLTHIGVYRCDYPGLSATMPVAIAEIDSRPARPGGAPGTGRDRAREPGARGQVAAAVRGRDRQGGRGLFVLPRSEAGFPQRGRRRSRPLRCQRRGVPPPRVGAVAAVAVGHDRAEHPRHQARRRCPRAHRRAVAGRGAVDRKRFGLGDARPLPDAATALFLWQNIFGVWPADGRVDGTLRARLHAYAEKAIREAHTHTSWNDPDSAFETAVHIGFAPCSTDRWPRSSSALVSRLDRHAGSDALGQKCGPAVRRDTDVY